MTKEQPTLKDLVNIHIRTRFPQWKFRWENDSYGGGAEVLVDDFGYLMAAVFDDKILLDKVDYVLAADPDFFPRLDAAIIKSKREVRAMWGLVNDDDIAEPPPPAESY